MTELEKTLKELENTWDYTQEELNDISEKMRGFAWACLMDSEVREELEKLEEEQFN